MLCHSGLTAAMTSDENPDHFFLHLAAKAKFPATSRSIFLCQVHTWPLWGYIFKQLQTWWSHLFCEAARSSQWSFWCFHSSSLLHLLCKLEVGQFYFYNKVLIFLCLSVILNIERVESGPYVLDWWRWMIYVLKFTVRWYRSNTCNSSLHLKL